MLQCELAKKLGGATLAESKVYSDAASALKGLTFDGMVVMSGGFGLSGNPETLIAALKDDGVKNITVIAEVIAMNHLLRYSGVHAAENFNERLKDSMQKKADVGRYLQDDDE